MPPDAPLIEALPSPVFGPTSVVPDVAERIFAEPSNLSEVAWDEENVILSEKESRTSPGPIQFSVTPHARWPREQMGNPALRQLTIQKMDQAAISRMVINRICRIVAEAPRNIAYIINSLEEARRMSDRVKASLLSCPATRDQVIEDPAEDIELLTLTFKLRDMTICFIGGGSIGAVAGKQIALVIVDEADKIPRVSSEENTHIVDEGKSRFKSVPLGDALIIVFSKPNQEIDIVHTEWKLGTQRRGHMPCPFCGHMQEWVQERMRFDHCKLPSGDYDRQRVLSETHYLCARAGTPECPDGRIYDHHRGYTTARITYIPSNPNPEPGHESVLLSDFLLNPAHFPDAALGRIALDLIAGFKNPAKMKAIQAARFGLPEMGQRVALKEDDILALRGSYRRGTAPRGLVYTAIYSDLQGYGPKWVKGGFRRNGEMVIVDWGTFLAIDDLLPEAGLTFPEVDESRPDLPRTGRLLQPMNGGIDEGDQQKIVLSFCIRSGFFFLPTKGRGGIQIRGATLVAPSLREHEGQKFEAYHFNDDQFKKELYLQRIRDHSKIIAGRVRVPRMWLPIDVDDNLKTELMNERLVRKPNKNGFMTEVWEKVGPNDFGDAVKGLMVLWHVRGPDIIAALEAEEAAAAAASPPPA